MAYSSCSNRSLKPNSSLLRRIDGAIQVRSNVDLTFYSLVGSGRSGGDHHGSSLLENPNIPYQCMDSYLSSTGLGSASMENGAPNNASSQTKNYEIAPFILGRRRDRTIRAFSFMFFPEVWRKQQSIGFP
uniref:Uncharacterized protein ycf68 n=1 Tax=Colchicum autumnale TaxID=45005 RepID=A0A162BGM3_COLAT|nr:hypothetical chloroplast RF68 [Colchicum autumnale]YP_009251703.1 hypothetical chloroplast RF68 [Colchicum autumnale]AKB92973.1 hypothetical chloroplast RF68 [Colchicum autumnale]AKB92986.1 hypothetical chloroplast RF68 [Colchicum autumnale]